MDDIAELERRLTAALARVGQAVDRLSTAPERSNGDSDVSEQLDAERQVNAALEARVKAIQETQDTKVAALEGDVARLKAALSARDAEVQSLKALSEGLRDTNAALRDAVARNGMPPMEEAREAEVRALRAERKSERAEIDDLFAALEPILREESPRA